MAAGENSESTQSMPAGNRLLDRLRGRSLHGGLDAIPRHPADAPVPLSFAQERLWFLEQLGGLGGAYNVAEYLHIRGALDRSALEAGLREIVRRHEILRTCYSAPDGVPLQHVRDDWALGLEFDDLTDLEAPTRYARALQIALDEARRPFDLQHDLPIRARLIRLDDQEHRLLLVIHHIAADAWSMGLLWRELAGLYQAGATSHGAAPADLPIQYRDHGVWQRQQLSGAELERRLDYWRRQLRDLPVLNLPTTHSRPPVQTYFGAEHRYPLPGVLSSRIRELARSEGCTPFMALLAAFQVLLLRYTGQEDFPVGVPVANRSRRETEALIGFFVNTLVIRADMTGAPGFRELLRRVRSTVVGALENQDLPFEKLVHDIHSERSLSRNPLFQVTFAVPKSAEPALADLVVRREELATGWAHFDLEFQVREEDGGFCCEIVWNSALFDRPAIERMAVHYRNILEQVTADAEMAVSRIAILTPEEELEAGVAPTEPQGSPEDGVTVVDLFESQVRRTPNGPALLHEGMSLSYAELDRRAGLLAECLRTRGIGPESLVGICLPRSFDLVAAIIGVLKAGGAYLPLDPAYPRDRLKYMVQDAAASLVLIDPEVAGGLLTDWSSPGEDPGGPRRVMTLVARSAWENAGERSPEHPARQPIECGSLAYVMYTSGSTGAPKGVAINHRGPAALVRWAIEEFGPEHLAGMLFSTSVCFDPSVLEIFAPLCCGGKVVIVRDALAAGDSPHRTEVTFLNTVPSIMAELVRSSRPSLSPRVIGMVGEPLNADLVRRCYALPGVEDVYNLYGPTEDSVYSTCYRVPADIADPVPIGRPLPGRRAFIVDRALQLVPKGVPGELYLSGAGLARGYWNHPELTDERFIPNPFQGESGSRLYRTGDLCRRREDGALEFLGRVDDQVKIRGFRVEIGEVENVLRRHPGIETALVSARRSRTGDNELLACVVAGGSPPPSAAELRAYLGRLLPDFMIPGAFLAVRQIPTTRSGKLDRSALSALEEAGPPSGAESAAPETAVEQELAETWGEVLGKSGVGVLDSFFDLGGHSLLAVRLMAAVEKRFGVNLPLASIYEDLCVRNQAARIARQPGREEWPNLVGIQTRGSRPPFFCMHPLCGDVVGFHAWAAHLGDDQPLYGLRARGLDGVGEPFEDIRTMAAGYVSQIRRIQPRGPYRIGGYGPGSVTAYEAAQQLRSAGEEIALLAVINHPAPGSGYHRVRLNLRFLTAFPANLVYWSREAARFRFARLLYFLHLRLTRSGWHAREGGKPHHRLLEALDRRWQAFGRRVLGEHDIALLMQGGVPGEHGRRQMRVADAHRLAIEQYRAQPFPGRITVFRTLRQPLLCSFERDLGWSGLALGGVTVREVTGSTAGLLKQPHARRFAEALKKELEMSDR